MEAVALEKTFVSDRESFRDRFDTRLIRSHGDVNLAACAVSKSRQTIHVWRQPDGPLPDIFQVEQIANARKESPAWLAYGVDPRGIETGRRRRWCFDHDGLPRPASHVRIVDAARGCIDRARRRVARRRSSHHPRALCGYFAA